MGDPAVIWDDEPEDEAVAWDDTAEDAPAPAPQPPQGPDEAKPERSWFEALARPVEAVARSAGGMLSNQVDAAVAGRDALENQIQTAAFGRGVLLPGIRTPQVSQRGTGAPASGYRDYLAEQKAANAASAAEYPITSGVTKAGTSIAQGLAIPQATAAPGAGVGARALAGAKNVGADAGLGFLGGGAEGAETAAGWSAGLRAPGAVGAGLRALARPTAKAAATVQSAGAAPGVRQAMQSAVDLGEQGKSFRQAALRGEEGLDDATREITSAVSDAERFADRILDASGVGMKRAPVAAKMAEEGIDQRAAIDISEGMVEDVWAELDGLMSNAQGVGKSALRKLLGGKKDAGAIGRAVENVGGEDASAAFVALDQLKRDIGRGVRQAGRGAEPDRNTEEALKALYERVRQHLEDPGVWGEGATQIQREVNAAWVPYIRKQRGLNQLAQSEVRGLQSADPWEVLSEGDPAKVQGLLEQAGTAGNELRERALSEALEAQEGISAALAKHYTMPEDVAAGASEIAERVGRVKGTLAQRIQDASAARQLKEAEAAGGVQLPVIGSVFNPAKAGRRLARLERGVEGRNMSGAGSALRGLARAGAVGAAAPSPGSYDPATVLAMIDENPDAFGELTPQVQAAAQSGNIEQLQEAIAYATRR